MRDFSPRERQSLPLPKHSFHTPFPPHPHRAARTTATHSLPTAFIMGLGLTAVGAIGMGLISFVVKVVHIPLTQVLVLKSE